MEWTSIIVSLLTTGGVVYLIVQRLFDRRKDKAEVKHQEVVNMREAMDYGIPMVSIYNEIDKIVESKTKPIQDKLDKALGRIDDLEANYCCYREECDFRIRNRKDAMTAHKIDSIAHETVRLHCKG